MKISKLLLVTLLAPMLSSAASAQTYIRFTGASANKTIVHKAITHVLAVGFTYGYQGTSLDTANAAIFTGTYGGNPVIIKTSWTGAQTGIYTVANSISSTFLPDSTPQSTGGTANAGGLTENAIPDVASYDSLQSSTNFPTPVLVATQIGVTPYVFVASKGAPAALSNITSQLAQNLWPNGTAALALFTGNPSDESTLVYATGRDADSGARLLALAETGIGVTATLAQFKPTISSGAVTGYTAYPQSTLDGIVYVAGNGGENKASTLATNLSATTNATVGYSIGYLATNDAATAISAGAKLLAYNGFSLPFSGGAFTSFTPITEGQYTFWGYSYLGYRSSFLGVGKTVADAIAQKLITSDAYILLTSMQVSRPGDGGLVTQNY